MRSGLAWATVVVILAAGCRGHSPFGTTASGDTATCEKTQLQLAAGPDLSPATGQNPDALRITNRGPRCVLAGYPVVRFTSPAGAALPFRLSDSGDSMVTGRHAGRVVVAHGGTAWVVLNKYRCDLGDRARVAGIEVRLAGGGVVGTVPPRASWGYCGPGDPGSTVHVSPFEPRLLGALRQD